MAHRRSWFFGLGCLFLIVVIVVGVVVVRWLAAPHVPDRAVLAIDFDGPIVEIAAPDPFAEIFGEKPLALRDIRTALVRAAQDDRIRGVRVRMDSFGGGLATAQEIRALLDRVHAAGKWTAAYMDTAGEFAPGNLEYLVVSACDEVSMNPMGDVNLVGLSVASPFVRGTLDKLGIEPEFPGHGAYKTARFMYTKKEFTPAAEEMMGWLLDSLMGQLTHAVATSRKLEPAKVRELIDQAPFLGQESVDAGLVDHLEDWTGFRDRLGQKEPGAKVVGLGTYVGAVRDPLGAPRVAVVTAVGTIMRGENRRSFSLFGSTDVMGSETIAEAFRNVRKASGVKAVLFRIDSPGGSAIASEVIRAEMARTAEKLPVVVSMSNVAGSGGYWITCGANAIFADPATLTASIGVFGGHLDMSAFFTDKLGVTFGTMQRGENADIYGSLEPWTDAQRAAINHQLDRIYMQFKTNVASSRSMSVDEVENIAEGRVFTGEQAKDKKLVDALGGFDEALAKAKELAGIAPETKVNLVDYPRPAPFWQRFLQHRQPDQEELRGAVEAVQRFWQTGTVEVPGAAWMPPMIVR